MARTKISEFSATAADNTDIDNIDIAEGCAPSGINNAIRELMAQLKEMQTGASGDTFTFASLVATTADINGGTVDGAAIGGASASTGAFTNLSYTGTLTGGTGVINIGSGQVYKDASGNLGLGVTPSAWSASVKAIQFGSNGSLANRTGGSGTYLSSNAYFSGDPSNTAANGVYINSTLASTYLQAGGSHAWYTAPSGTAGNAISFTQAMTLDASGNLGLGTTSPASYGNFVVKGSNSTNIITLSGATYGLRLGAGASGSTIQGVDTTTAGSYQPLDIAAGGQIAFLTGAAGGGSISERARIDSSGNVLIGGTSQIVGSKLNVIGAGAYIGVGSSTNNVLMGEAGDSTCFVGTYTSNDFVFRTNNTGRMRLTAAGEFMVGTTSTWFSRASIFEAAEASLAAIGNLTGAYPLSILNTGTSGDNLLIGFWTDSRSLPNQRGSISYNRAGGLTAYNTTSDYRAKDISGSINNALQVVSELKPYMGTMKGATIERPMFIAHETQAVAPYAVTGEKDAVDKDGNPQYQQMDHSTLVPLLTAAIQELKAEFDAYKASHP